MAIALAQQGKTRRGDCHLPHGPGDRSQFRSCHLNLAFLLAERERRSTKRSLIFAERFEIDPDVALSYNQFAQLLRKQGKTERGRQRMKHGATKPTGAMPKPNLRGTELARQGKTERGDRPIPDGDRRCPRLCRGSLQPGRRAGLAGQHRRGDLALPPGAGDRSRHLRRQNRPSERVSNP